MSKAPSSGTSATKSSSKSQSSKVDPSQTPFYYSDRESSIEFPTIGPEIKFSSDESIKYTHPEIETELTRADITAALHYDIFASMSIDLTNPYRYSWHHSVGLEPRGGAQLPPEQAKVLSNPILDADDACLFPQEVLDELTRQNSVYKTKIPPKSAITAAREGLLQLGNSFTTDVERKAPAQIGGRPVLDDDSLSSIFNRPVYAEDRLLASSSQASDAMGDTLDTELEQELNTQVKLTSFQQQTSLPANLASMSDSEKIHAYLLFYKEYHTLCQQRQQQPDQQFDVSLKNIDPKLLIGIDWLQVDHALCCDFVEDSFDAMELDPIHPDDPSMEIDEVIEIFPAHASNLSSLYPEQRHEEAYNHHLSLMEKASQIDPILSKTYEEIKQQEPDYSSYTPLRSIAWITFDILGDNERRLGVTQYIQQLTKYIIMSNHELGHVLYHPKTIDDIALLKAAETSPSTYEDATTSAAAGEKAQAESKSKKSKSKKKKSKKNTKRNRHLDDDDDDGFASRYFDEAEEVDEDEDDDGEGDVSAYAPADAASFGFFNTLSFMDDTSRELILSRLLYSIYCYDRIVNTPSKTVEQVTKLFHQQNQHLIEELRYHTRLNPAPDDSLLLLQDFKQQIDLLLPYDDRCFGFRTPVHAKSTNPLYTGKSYKVSTLSIMLVDDRLRLKPTIVSSALRPSLDSLPAVLRLHERVTPEIDLDGDDDGDDDMVDEDGEDIEHSRDDDDEDDDDDDDMFDEHPVRVDASATTSAVAAHPSESTQSTQPPPTLPTEVTNTPASEPSKPSEPTNTSPSTSSGEESLNTPSIAADHAVAATTPLPNEPTSELDDRPVSTATPTPTPAAAAPTDSTSPINDNTNSSSPTDAQPGAAA